MHQKALVTLCYCWNVENDEQDMQTPPPFPQWTLLQWLKPLFPSSLPPKRWSMEPCSKSLWASEYFCNSEEDSFSRKGGRYLTPAPLMTSKWTSYTWDGLWFLPSGSICSGFWADGSKPACSTWRTAGLRKMVCSMSTAAWKTIRVVVNQFGQGICAFMTLWLLK